MPELLSLFAQSFAIGFSGAVVPGPMFTATVSEGMKRGAWAGPRIVLGHGIIEFALLLALIAGLGPLLVQGRFWIAVIGGITLVLMGALMIRGARAAAETVHDTRGDPGILQAPEWAGILTSAGNPYFFAWWATIGLALTTASLKHGAAGVACFYTGHILSDFAWFSFVGAMSAKGREICSVVVLRRILAACGTVLLGLGLLFMLKAGW